MSVDDEFPTPEQVLEEFQKSSAGKGVAGRAEAGRLASENFRKALAVARRIEHPWYRCQAIASVVEAHPKHPEAVSTLEEAFLAASEQDEPNRVASVSFWPLKLMVGLSRESASAHVGRLLEVIAAESHGLRRLDGLSAILNAVMPDQELRGRVLTPFAQAAAASTGWRTERIVSGVAERMAPFDMESALRLLSSRPENRFSKKALETLRAKRPVPYAGT